MEQLKAFMASETFLLSKVWQKILAGFLTNFKHKIYFFKLADNDYFASFYLFFDAGNGPTLFYLETGASHC
jgi:hypothetical protein